MKKCLIVSASGEKSFSIVQAERLNSFAKVTFVKENRLLSDKEFVEMFKNYEIAALTRRIRKDIGAKILAQLPELKALAVFSTGYEWIDTDHMKKSGIKLACLPQYSTVSVAEHAVGLLLSALHRIHLSYDFSRDMLDAKISMRGFELAGKKTGIIGFGRIGQKVYSMLSSFEVERSYYDIDAKKREFSEDKFEDLDKLLSKSDIIILCASKKRNEKPIISFSEISKMKDGVIIINPARADLVDNDAVCEYIKSGKIFTYAVDEKTGAFKGIAKGRVIETGHTAWYSTEAVKRGTETWVENIIGLCTDDPVNLVGENF
ncbi:MAG: hypothetical protein LBL00_06540 [Endomicrobium sp.]|jgi:lactate dehydrogenase-like 2-hydroxyacid dehydrogenase|nr:hypothetical protein [Endomicrobium sp.]